MSFTLTGLTVLAQAVSTPIWLTVLVPIVVALITSVITGFITFRLQEHRLRTELRTEFMVEETVKQLLNHPKWEQRSFSVIKQKVGGFEDDDLRKLLVRSGALRFYLNNV